MSEMRHSNQLIELHNIVVLDYIQSISAIDFTQPHTGEPNLAKFHEEIPYEKERRMLPFGTSTCKMMRLSLSLIHI